MTGPQHHRRAEELAAKASQYPGPGDGQDSAAVRAAVAQVHATLALDAAIATTAAARAPPQARQYTPAATKTPTPRCAPVATDPGCPDPATVKPQAAKEHVPTPQGVNTRIYWRARTRRSGPHRGAWLRRFVVCRSG